MKNLLLFIRHEEGITFKHLPDYRNELAALYSDIIESNDKKDIMATIERVTDPFSNSMNEHRSRIKAIFVQKLGKELAVNYCIDGERGEPKSIALPREFVVWEGL